MLNKTDKDSRAVFGNENNKMLLWTVYIKYPGSKTLCFHLIPSSSIGIVGSVGIATELELCVREKSVKVKRRDLSLRLLGGLFAINIAHIPASNWIRTVEFLVESSFIVLLESYLGAGLSHTLLLGLFFFFFFSRAFGSFIRFWSRKLFVVILLF